MLTRKKMEDFNKVLEEINKKIGSIQSDMESRLRRLENNVADVPVATPLSFRIADNSPQLETTECFSKIKPPTYDGQTSWKCFKTQFEVAALGNRWNSSEKAINLAASLRGSATEVLQSLPLEQSLDYERLIHALTLRFGDDILQPYHVVKLKNRRQKRDETLQELAADVERLARLAFPDCPRHVQDLLAHQNFVDAIEDPECQQSVRMSEAKTLQEALIHALKFETARDATRGYQKVVRVVKTDESQKDGDIKEAISQLQRTVEEMKKVCLSQNQPRGPIASAPTDPMPKLSAGTVVNPDTLGLIAEYGRHLRRGAIPFRNIRETKISQPYGAWAGYAIVVNLLDSAKTLGKGTEIAIAEPVTNVAHCPTVENLDKSPCSSLIPGHLQELLEGTREGLNWIQQKKLEHLLCQYEDVFATSPKDVGRTNVTQHRIDTGGATPVKQLPRRLPMTRRDEVAKLIEEMAEQDVIEPSSSPWASPVVLVKKKDGSTRFCVDYRRLNDLTKKDSYPLPRIDATLDTLSGSQWFSTLDLKIGYWQVSIHPEDREKTAFTTGNGLWQFKVMPFGLCNAPATFERLMETVLQGIPLETCLVYLDDIIVMGKSFEEHLINLERVLQKIRVARLKLNPRKCKPFKEKVRYLGHVISRQGIQTDPDRTETVRQWPVPRDVHQLRSFLGLCSYYRRFVPGFSNIARPLHRLTESGRPFSWTIDCERAMDKLKQALSSPPMLAYPDPGEPFILDTDASNTGIGAVLSQTQDGVERVIAYFSKTLSKPERNYCVTRRELLAIVKSIEHFHHYLYGQKFLLRTDHAALRWLLNFKSPEGQLARWIQRLQEYDMEIQHRKGKSHGNADALSRRPCPVNCKHCSKAETQAELNIRQLSLAQELKLDEWSPEEMRKSQFEDADLRPVMNWLNAGTNRPAWEDVASCSPITKSYWSLWDSLEFRVKERFYWAGCRASVEKWVRQCTEGASRKGPKTRSRARLKTYNVGAPVERIAIDIMGPLPRSDKGNRYILVAMDYFTKWPEAFPLADQEAETVAETFISQFFSRFGVPMQIHTDQRRNFESRLFAQMCKLLGSHKTRTTPLHPQSDGMVERFNRTLASQLSLFVAQNQRDWDSQLPILLMAYRSSVHETTGYSPAKMLFGRELKLPCDLIFGCPNSIGEGSNEFVDRLHSRLEKVHRWAREKLEIASEAMKVRYDTHACGNDLQEGGLVWLYNPKRKKGLSPKLQKSWEGPFRIVKKLNDVVFRIQRSSHSKPKVVHFNRLAPFEEPLISAAGEKRLRKPTEIQKWDCPEENRRFPGVICKQEGRGAVTDQLKRSCMAKRLGLDEDQWAFSLLGLLPYEMTQLIAQETEEQSDDYRFVKRLLLKRYKLSPEQFRQKFEKHEKSQKRSWRDFAFELRGYFNEWIEGMNVENFDALKDLSVTNQLKKKVPNVLRNHLIDDWTKINNPDELADKLDEYENVRTEMGPPHWNSKHTMPPSFQQKSARFPNQSEIKETEQGTNVSSRDAARNEISEKYPNTSRRMVNRAIRNDKGEPKCFYCNQFGHIARDCPVPKVTLTCRGCGQTGHKESNCTRPKEVLKVANLEVEGLKTVPPDVYLKDVKIDNKETVKAMIDTGSSSFLLRESVARRINDDIEPDSTSLYGIGNQTAPAARTVGKTTVDLEIDGVVGREISVFIVNDDAQPYGLLIGRTWTDLPYVSFAIIGKKLHIGYSTEFPFPNLQEEIKSRRVELRATETVQLESDCINFTSAITDEKYDFDIRHKPGEKMAHVDGMSRAPVDDPKDTMEEIVEKNLEVCSTITLEEQILMIQHSDEDVDPWTELERIQESVRTQIENKQEIMKKYYDNKKCCTLQFEVGEIVVMRHVPKTTGEPTKAQPKYRGPLIITEVLPSDTYRVTHSTPISTVSMPRRKIRAHCEHMSEFETGRAIGLKEAGWSNRLIARHLCRNDAAIRRYWQKWVNNGSMQRQDGGGRPRATTEREDRAIVRMAVAAPESTLSTIQRVTGTQVSKMTINRRLRERNLRARRPLRCLPLTPVHRQVRLQWCRERSTWNCANWGRIVFSDESHFLLCPDDRRKRVWRRPGQRVDPGLTVEHHTGPQQGVMVWGAISFDSRTPLVVIPGTLTAQQYVDDILRPVLLPFLSHHPGLTFQQDNARSHTARVTMDCLQSCRTLPWPARSPDLSPIEHMMGRRLQPSRNESASTGVTSEFTRLQRSLRLRERLRNLQVYKGVCVYGSDFGEYKTTEESASTGATLEYPKEAKNLQTRSSWQNAKSSKRKNQASPLQPSKVAKAAPLAARSPQQVTRTKRDPVTAIENSRQQQDLAKARSAAATFDQCCLVEWSADFHPVQYIMALEQLLGKSSVYQLMKMSGQVLVGLASVDLAERLVEEGLTIGATLLKAFSYRQKPEKIVVGNLPLAIRDDDVIAALRPYCRVVSLTHEVVSSGGYTWTTGNREAFVLLNEGRKLHQLPAKLMIISKGESTPAYITYGVRCNKCYRQGHPRAICPLGINGGRHQDLRQGPVSRPSPSKPMPSNNSALSTPAAESSAPIKQTNSTPSSPASSPGANIPVHPQETPTHEPPFPAPSTSQLLPRPEPFLTIIDPTAAPKKTTHNETAPSIQSSTSMTQPMQPLQESREILIGR
ncbi:K02A2.6-like, partial [Cordylochernes scorpioides]